MSQVDIVVDLINKQDIVVDSSEISKTGINRYIHEPCLKYKNVL